MTIGGRQFTVRRRWLALLSLGWFAGIYALWIVLHSSGGLAERPATQCTAVDPFYEAYAQCLQFAAQAVVNRQEDVARMATFISIAPVAALWAIWLAGRFLRECRSADCAEPVA